ncbi:MAG: hypothetical protein Q9217_000330 [Psora testacea]
MSNRRTCLLPLRVSKVASNVFGLSHAVVQCDASTTVDDFSNGILLEGAEDQGRRNEEDEISRKAAQGPRLRNGTLEPQISISKGIQDGDDRDKNRSIANMVVLTGISKASDHVQIQALENDHIFISHYHNPEDGFPNLADTYEWMDDDRASMSSVVHRSINAEGRKAFGSIIFPEENIKAIQDLVQNVSFSVEFKRYLQNIVVFLRMHRAVGGGITPLATKHFDLFVKCLAPFHDLTFVTPPLVSLACRKVYAHRIRITKPQSERSMQYGSDLTAVVQYLKSYTADQVIDEVLDQVEIPL